MKSVIPVVAILIILVLGFGFRNKVVYLANALNIADFFNQNDESAQLEPNQDVDPDKQQAEQDDDSISREETESPDDQGPDNQGSDSGSSDDQVAGNNQSSSNQPAHGNSSPGIPSNKPKNQQPTGFLILVNKQVKLSADYVPENLVIPNIPFPFSGTHEKMYMQADAASALEQMFAQARKENIHLYGLSGYRSYQTQKDIFAYNVKRFGSEAEANKISARPGESEHQTGLAMDITAKRVNYQLVFAFADTPEGKWVKDNAHKFGFIIRYPQGKEDITGYVYEPWHLRYVGVECATEIYTQGITLEEYLQGKI